MWTMTLDQFIRHAGLSHEAFARQIGVSRQAVARYRNGDRLPEPDVMRRIVDVTAGEVTPNDFYGLSGGCAGETLHLDTETTLPRAAAAGE